MPRVWHLSTIVWAWLLLACPARAQTEPAPRSLTYAEAIEQVADHPDVRAPLAAAGVLRGTRIRRANGYPSLSVQGGYDDSSGGRVATGSITPTYSVILMRQSRAARDSVDTRRAALVAEARATLLVYQLAVVEAWLTLHPTESILDLLAEEIVVLDSWLEALEGGQEVGAATVVDIAEVQAQRADVTQAIEHWRMEGEARERALVRALALPVRTRITTAGDPPDPRPRRGLDPGVIAARLPASDLARRQTDQAEASLRHDLSTFWPGQLDISAEVGLDHRSVVGVVTLQAPMASAQRAQRAHDEASRVRSEVEEESSLRQAAFLVHDTQATLESAERSLAQMRGETIPRHEALLSAQLELRAAGQTTTFAVLDAKRRLLESRAREAALDVTERVARVRLQLLLEAAGPPRLDEGRP